jgi:hypothetical protein
MERRRSLAAALAISVVMLTQAYSAEEQKPRVPGIYSDLAYSNEGGDLLGTEMFIIPIGHVCGFLSVLGRGKHAAGDGPSQGERRRNLVQRSIAFLRCRGLQGPHQ